MAANGSTPVAVDAELAPSADAPTALGRGRRCLRPDSHPSQVAASRQGRCPENSRDLPSSRVAACRPGRCPENSRDLPSSRVAASDTTRASQTEGRHERSESARHRPETPPAQSDSTRRQPDSAAEKGATPRDLARLGAPSRDQARRPSTAGARHRARRTSRPGAFRPAFPARVHGIDRRRRARREGSSQPGRCSVFAVRSSTVSCVNFQRMRGA
jgi:hypothetical protein